MKTREELEKMFDEEFDLGEVETQIENCNRDMQEAVKEFIFEVIIPEILKSVLPEWNKQTYISTYKNYIKPKAKELYNINL